MGEKCHHRAVPILLLIQNKAGRFPQTKSKLPKCPFYTGHNPKPPTNQSDNDSLSATFIFNILICANFLKA